MVQNVSASNNQISNAFLKKGKGYENIKTGVNNQLPIPSYPQF